MLPDDFKQARLDTVSELKSGFAIGDGAAFNFIQPVIRMDAEFFLDLKPIVTRPIAEIHLP